MTQKPRRSIKTQTSETGKGASETGKGTSSKKTAGVGSKSPYSLHRLENYADKKTETDDSLLEQYLKDKNHISITLAHQKIDKAIGEEMKKTIYTLNEYVEKVELAQTFLD